MNVLLLISALLSALTGVDAGGVRSPVAAERVAASRAAAVAVALAAPRVRHAPTQVFDIVGARRLAAPLVRLPRLELPAFASRRRE